MISYHKREAERGKEERTREREEGKENGRMGEREEGRKGRREEQIWRKNSRIREGEPKEDRERGITNSNHGKLQRGKGLCFGSLS